VRSTAVNQNDREILTWIRWVMVKKRDRTRPAPPPVISGNPPCVTAARLAVPEFLDAASSNQPHRRPAPVGDYRPGSASTTPPA